MAVVTTYEFVIDNTFFNAATTEQLALAAAGQFYVAGGFSGPFATTAFGVLAGSGTGSTNLPGTELALAVLTGGNYVAVTQSGGDLLYRIYNQYHIEQTAPLIIEYGFASNPDVAALDNGGFVTAIQYDYEDNDFDLFLNFYDAAGVVQNNLRVDGSTADDRDASIAVLDNGKVAVGWMRTVGAETEIWTAVYSQSGTVVKGPTLVDTVGERNEAVELTATATGYAMAYRDLSNGGPGLIEVRSFDNSGNALAATVLPDSGLDLYDPSITRLSNGMLAVGYSDTGFGVSFNALIDPSNLAVLAVEEYAPSLSDFIFRPELAAFGAGRLVQMAFDQTTNSAIVSEMTVRRVMTGDNSADKITALNDLSHHLIGGGGNDKLYGGAQNDLLEGGTGNDLLDGKGGGDEMVGGAGNDSYIVDSAGDETTEASGGGTDKVTTGLYTYELAANVENLTMTGVATYGFGNNLNNTITGNANANVLFGGGGKDKLDGKGGADAMEGGDGDDTYYVDNVGDEVIETNSSANGGGKDTVNFSLNNEGYGLGANVENGNAIGSGTQDLYGNELANTLTSKGNSNAFTHSLYGGGGKDTLKGGNGSDRLDGGTGADILTGGGGNDTFVFSVLETSANKDTIKDFNFANDLIVFMSSAFGGLAGAAGQSLGNSVALQDMFFVGTSAGDAEDRIIYDTVSGNLWYDEDGSGAAAQILVAVLTGSPDNVDASDFYIF